MEPRILVQACDFDVAAETALLANGRTDIGALVHFTGLCRDEAGQLSGWRCHASTFWD
jgi:molybdopterin synthase catalytic subunit